MDNEHFLYEALYQSLLADLRVGNLKYGDKLPSQKQICERYQVGTAVVRGALRKLEQDGFISISQGKRASVIYQKDSFLYAHTLLERKNAIADAFMGMGLLAPPIFEVCARLDGRNYGDTLGHILKLISLDRKKGNQASTHYLSLAAKLLKPLNNPLLYDLHMDYQLFTRIPDLRQTSGERGKNQSSLYLHKLLKQTIQTNESGRFDEFQDLNVQIFQHLKALTTQYLESLDSGHPGVNRDAVQFSWSADKGGKLYNKVALDLLKQIEFGEYKEGDFLPSFSEVTRLYGVAPVTARSAYAVLDTFGVVETVSGLGSKVTFQKPRGREELLQDDVLRQRLIRFLDAAQILALTIKKIALLTFPYLDREKIERTNILYHRKPFQRFTSNALGVFLALLRDDIPCKSVVNIYQQLTELLFWGYYLQRIEGISETVKVVYGLCGEVLSALTRGEAQAFACELERTFVTTYILYWDISAGLGLDKAQMPHRLTMLAERLGCPVPPGRDAQSIAPSAIAEP